jgi:hypothetical protein
MDMLKKFRMPLLALSLATYFLLFSGFPAVAGLVPSVPSSPEMADTGRGEQIDRIQKVLEMQIVTDKLQAYGLSAAEVSEKLEGMSAEQLHLMAQASDRVLAGGDGVGLVIGLLVVVILVILILMLLDKEIVIK